MSFPAVYVNTPKNGRRANNSANASNKIPTLFEMARDDPGMLKPIPVVPIKAQNPWAVLLVFLIVWVVLDVWLKLFYVGLRRVSGRDEINTKTLLICAVILTIIAVVLVFWSGISLEQIEHELDI